MKEATYKNRKIRALSYKLEGGVWIAHVEVLTNGAVHGHSVNGQKQYPTQEAADVAAIGMGETWTDSHIPPHVPRRRNSGFTSHPKLGSKRAKQPAGANGKAASTNGAKEPQNGKESGSDGKQGNGKQGR
jgi:hypothetical protein